MSLLAEMNSALTWKHFLIYQLGNPHEASGVLFAFKHLCSEIHAWRYSKARRGGGFTLHKLKHLGAYNTAENTMLFEKHCSFDPFSSPFYQVQNILHFHFVHYH